MLKYVRSVDRLVYGRGCCLQAQFTGQSMETITRDTDRDFFMSPQEAIEYGLIDALVAKPLELQARELITTS